MHCLVVTDDYSRFTWVFFLATKNETSGILKSFITRIENLVDHKVKEIRCDNEIEFINREMNQFCEMNGILRQFSVARTPQQNRVVERRNTTLIEAAKIMLADFKLPTTFWAEAVSTACYVQNRVLVVKPHNKTPYELFHGRTPSLSFMRPFRCLVTIINTIDHLGNFNGKADEGFFVGYSLNSKAFRVLNSRTGIVEENLHIRFSKSTPNVLGSGLDWLFDIDTLKRKINYEPIVVDSKSSHDDGSKPSSDDRKKIDEDLRKENECKDQERKDNVNSTNNVNTGGNVNNVSSTVNAAGTQEVNVVGEKISIKLPFDPKMSALEDDSIFGFSSDDEDDCVVANINNLDTTIQVSPIPTIRIHKDHPLDQVIRYLQSATSSFLYGKIEEEVYVCQPPRFEDPDFPDRVYKVEKHCMDYIKLLEPEVKTASTSMETQKPLLKDEDSEEVDVHMYRSMIGSLMYLTSSRPDIMFTVCACAIYQINPKVSSLHDVKRMFRYLKGQPKLGLWYPKDSPFDLVAYTDSDYAGASLDRKSTTRGEGSTIPTDAHHTPTIILPSTQPQKTQQPRKPKRKDTQVPQPCDPIKNVPDKAVHKELGNSLVRATTTTSSLEAEHDSESSSNEESLGEDASKQERIDAIDAYKDITLEVFVVEHEVAIKRVNDEVNVVEEVVKVINTAKLIINAAQDSVDSDIISTASAAITVSVATITTATITTVDDITLAQALKEIKKYKTQGERDCYTRAE
nr:hypothetical protein [Tanacetum cinerariifolium]